MSRCFLMPRSMFVWVDETGTDKRDNLRKFGYGLRGTTPTYHRILTRGQRVNVIAAMTSEGMLTTDVTMGHLNGEKFYDFLRGTLIPMMRLFDGTNPHSVLILDNCSVHHTEEVTELLTGAGIIVFFLPPYSPDLNPIEEAFSYVKQYLKNMNCCKF